MRKFPVLFAAALGFMAGAAVPAFADDTRVPPPARPAAAAPASKDCAPGSPESHGKGMKHGADAMHETMMRDHREGMQGQAPQGQTDSMPGMTGMSGNKAGTPSGKPGMKMEKCSGSGCKGEPSMMQQMPMGHM